MGRVTAKIKLNQFYLREQNDQGGKDEPYLLTLFARIDRTINDAEVPLTERVLPIHFPERLGHGDLGPDSKGMSVTGRSVVKVPAQIGEWEATLDSETLDISSGLMRNCALGLGVMFLEEDSTLDSTIEAMLPEAKKEIRRQANKFLRFILGVPPNVPANLPNRQQIFEALDAYRRQLLEEGIDVNGIIDGGALMDHVLAAVFPGQIGKAAGKAVIPFVELGNIIAAITQGTDRDELIGSNGRTFSFYDIVGRAHAPIKFDIDSVNVTRLTLPFIEEPIAVPITSRGVYAVDGTVRRTDADEPPLLAAVRGPEQNVTVFGRILNEGSYRRNRSADFGRHYETDNSGNFDEGRFLSGPAAASADGGAIQCVAGLGLDHEIWFALSRDGGDSWVAWNRISARKKFKSAPAVALNADGTKIYVVGRDEDNFYWFTKSADPNGAAWSDWRRVGTSAFLSSPAIVHLSERVMLGGGSPDVLVVAGLGSDQRVWTTRFRDSASAESLAGHDWTPIRAGSEDHPTAAFTSAPAMTSDGRLEILLVCRANDLRFWGISSFDGGREFGVGTVWLSFGRPERGRVRYDEEDGER
ncbi:MAG TPA: hypothetical protein VM870_05650, partial [Pyrinomonadaceae bacterium]|nr:hypothetical protein [Pyrinomonadaceae bacterium]